MSDTPGRPYQVVYSEQQQSLVRTLGQRAGRRGLLNAYLDAIKLMRHHLAVDPLSWGDPHNRLRHLGLILYQRIQGPLRLYYAVDEQRRIVYLRTIKPMPHLGLDDEG